MKELALPIAQVIEQMKKQRIYQIGTDVKDSSGSVYKVSILKVEE